MYLSRTIQGWITNQSHNIASLTLGRFVEGPARGVPSLFSRILAVGTDSSRSGRTLRSAYFRQFVPQVSQRMLVGRPFGAFHHVLDSRVRQAPQLGVFEGCAIIDASSSEWPTCCPLLASAKDLYCALMGAGGGPAFFSLRVSSPSFVLWKSQ